MTSRKLQIFKFVLIEMFSPCVLNSRVISFLVGLERISHENLRHKD